MCHGVPDELREQAPTQRRIGEHAQSRHLDVDHAPEEERLKPIEGSSNLFQKVNRREAIRVVSAPSLVVIPTSRLLVS